MLLIVSPESDTEAHVIARALRDRGMDVVFFDPLKFHSTDPITAYFPQISDANYTILIGENNISISDIETTWFRRLPTPAPDNRLEESDQRVSENETLSFLRSVYQILSEKTHCVSSYDAIYFSEKNYINYFMQENVDYVFRTQLFRMT